MGPAGLFGIVAGIRVQQGNREGPLPSSLACPAQIGLDSAGSLHLQAWNALLRIDFEP